MWHWPTFESQASYYYTQVRYMLFSAGFLVATMANPLAKGIRGMREFPIKVADKATKACGKLKECWTGVPEPDSPLSTAAKKDEMIDVLLRAKRLFSCVNGEASKRLARDFGLVAPPEEMAKKATLDDLSFL